MIKQRNDIVEITFRMIFYSWWTIKTLTPNQNPSCYNELQNLNFTGVDANIVIFTIIVLGVNGALDLLWMMNWFILLKKSIQKKHILMLTWKVQELAFTFKYFGNQQNYSPTRQDWNGSW